MSPSATAPTFIDACLKRRASPDEIDDWVERWHGLGPRDRRTLAEYLGMSRDEYARWVERPAALASILHERRERGPADGRRPATTHRARVPRRR